MDVTQSGKVPLLGGEEERFRVLASLDHGTWKDVQVTVLADPDPKTPLWGEGPWPFPLGGDHTRGVAAGPAPDVHMEPDGWRYTWRRDAMTYRVDTDPAGVVRQERFTLPDKVEAPQGWARDIVWSLRHDPAGWPVAESLDLVVGKGLVRVTLAYRLAYAALGPCPGAAGGADGG